MEGQLSFASLDFAAKKKRTKRDVFLAEMATVVPWAALEGVIEPHYPKTGAQGGRRPFPLAVMLRIYCLQQWYMWTTPTLQEKSDVQLAVGCKSCVRPVRAVHVTAGPDVSSLIEIPINLAGCLPMYHCGISRSTDRPLRITPSSPSQLERACRREFYSLSPSLLNGYRKRRRAIGFAPSQHRPGDACHLVGQRQPLPPWLACAPVAE